MYSYEIKNNITGEKTIIFGYSWNNAVRRSGIDENEWTVITCDYED